jgi:hypothetical protein
MKIVKVNENTVVPLSLVWTVGTAIAGGIVWLSFLAFQVNAATDDIEILKQKEEIHTEDYNRSFATIKSDLRLIKRQLGIEDEK